MVHVRDTEILSKLRSCDAQAKSAAPPWMAKRPSHPEADRRDRKPRCRQGAPRHGRAGPLFRLLIERPRKIATSVEDTKDRYGVSRYLESH